MESVILWYDVYMKTLKSQGFVVNPCDRCIENITIDGKQCTIACYVDDEKSSNVDEHTDKRIIESIA